MKSYEEKQIENLENEIFNLRQHQAFFYFWAIVIIIALAGLAYVKNQQINERIDCTNVPKSVLRQLDQSGIILPPNCINPIPAGLNI